MVWSKGALENLYAVGHGHNKTIMPILAQTG